MQEKNGQTSSARWAVSRRGLLLGAGATLAVTMLSEFARPAPARAASPLSPRRVVAELAGAEVRYFDPGHTQALGWRVPSLLAVTAGAAVLRASTVEVTWDERMARATSDRVILATDDEVRAVPATIAPGRMTFRWPSNYVGGTSDLTQCVLPLTQNVLYPADALEDVAPARAIVRLRRPGAEVIASAPVMNAPISGVAWGASLSATTMSSDLPDDPTVALLIRIDSVGPGEIPAGAQLLVEAERSHVIECNFLEEQPGAPGAKAYSAASPQGTDALSTEVVLSESIPANQSRTLRMQLRKTARAAIGLHPLVMLTFRSTDPLAVSVQRTTMSESVVL